MPKPFDSITRFLHRLDARAWARFLGVRAKTIELCDTDLSTVASQADSLLLIDKSWALHFENETSYRRNTSWRAFEYNVLSDKVLNVPVRTVIFLLRKEADGPSTNGVYERRLPGGTRHIEFRYEVVRVWQIPPQRFFDCGLGMLPLAFVSNIDAHELPTLVKHTQSRLQREADSKTAAEIWTAIDVLLGLKYEREQIERFLKGIRHMEDSVTYQAIMKKGEANEARSTLFRLATERFGKPSARVVSKLNRINDKNALEDLIMRTQIVANWNDLLK